METIQFIYYLQLKPRSVSQYLYKHGEAIVTNGGICRVTSLAFHSCLMVFFQLSVTGSFHPKVNRNEPN